MKISAKNSKYVILIMTVLVLLLIITNPSEHSHIETAKIKFKTAFKSSLTDDILNDKDDEKISSSIGLLFADAFVDNFSDGIITRDNYLIFSLTKVKIKDVKRTIGVGFLNNVFISDKVSDHINEFIKKDNEEELSNEEDNINEVNDDEISDDEYKRNLSNYNTNDKYEFDDKMLIGRYYFDDNLYNGVFDDNLCVGKILNISKDYYEIELEVLKFNDCLSNIEDVFKSKKMTIYFDNIEYNGKSDMCEECEINLRKLLKINRVIYFSPVEALCGGSACHGVFSFGYIKNFNTDEDLD